MLVQNVHIHLSLSQVPPDGGLSALAYLAALLMFTRQAGLSRTAFGITRVSRWTFLVNATIDAVCFAGHITFAILAEGRASLALMATAFLSCVLFIQEAVGISHLYSIMTYYFQQFAALIFQVQGSESPPAPPALPTTRTVGPTMGNQTTTATPPARNDDPHSSFFRFFLHHVRTDPQARLCPSTIP